MFAMPRPMHRARTWRRIKKRTPGASLTLHYEKRKAGKAKCAICATELHGVPALRPYQMGKLAKTEKRPERPYGGVICPNCLARGIREAVRASLKH